MNQLGGLHNKQHQGSCEFETISLMDTPWLEHITMLTWRMATYATLNLIDDAAMLAILFC